MPFNLCVIHCRYWKGANEFALRRCGFADFTLREHLAWSLSEVVDRRTFPVEEEAHIRHEPHQLLGYEHPGPALRTTHSKITNEIKEQVGICWA